jgi:hypothetical protein
VRDAPVALVLQTETGLPLRMIGTAGTTLEPGEVFSLPLTLRAEPGSVQGRHPIVVNAMRVDGSIAARAKSHFFAPESP